MFKFLVVLIFTFPRTRPHYERKEGRRERKDGGRKEGRKASTISTTTTYYYYYWYYYYDYYYCYYDQFCPEIAAFSTTSSVPASTLPWCW